MTIRVNGKNHDVEANGSMPLLWVLRDILNMTGTKYGCGVASCGSCMVHMNGKAIRTCVTPLSAAEGADIVTIEGLAEGDKLSAVQRAWIEHQVPQCGYCQSGMIMAVEALLNETNEPSDEQIDTTISNICRCGTYQRVKAAIKTAAALRAQDEPELLGMN